MTQASMPTLWKGGGEKGGKDVGRSSEVLLLCATAGVGQWEANQHDCMGCTACMGRASHSMQAALGAEPALARARALLASPPAIWLLHQDPGAQRGARSPVVDLQVEQQLGEVADEVGGLG